MSTDLVLYDTHDHVASIRLNRPGVRNAINLEMANLLDDAFLRMDQDEAVRVGVLTARTTPDRPVFCAGADLREVAAGRGMAIATHRGGWGGFARQPWVKPLIVAVDGLAVAAGCELALTGDLLLASPRSAFALSEVSLGGVPGAGGLFRLPLAVGSRVAMAAMLTGEHISSARAFDLGMVNAVVASEQLETEAFRLAEVIAVAPPAAVLAACRAVRAVWSPSSDEMWAETERALEAVGRSLHSLEGAASFVEKRSPRWAAHDQ